MFIHDLTQDVFHLTTNCQSRADPEYAKILERLIVGKSTEEDAERLMRQCLHHHRSRNDAWIEEIENNPTTIFLYIQNFEKPEESREASQTL